MTPFVPPHPTGPTIEGSFRIAVVERTLRQAREAEERRKRSYDTQSPIAMVVTILSFVGAFITVGFGLILFFPALIWLIVVWAQVAKSERKLNKIRFAHELVQALQDEVAPGCKVAIRFDPRSYDRTENRYWTGRSQHGNTKYRYADRWFDLRFTLPEGTAVRIQRHADVKVKKGSIQGEKRRLRVQVDPNRRAWKGFQSWEGLKPLLQLNVQQSFHNLPEDLRVAPKAANGGAIRIRVEQHDADIKPREAMLVLETVLLFLSQT